ncbi:MAG: PAS domain S-box protein [Candidatus Cloacimonetes bacterium]|nr:PAS domain S-box protein [Candidatus Cloacimonadota bacterium]
MKILIVDDKKENLYLLETLLKGSGYEVESALNGAEALEKLYTQNFDMIISDILMPRMDGFQFCRKVMADKILKNIPFVFYTATYKNLKDEEFALKLGADKYLRKPMEPVEFIKIIQDVFRDVEKGKGKFKGPALKEEKEILKLYSERLVNKLEKKMLDLEREITERKKVEEKIQYQNEFLNKVLESLTHPFFVVDAHDYTISMANSAVGIKSDFKKVTCHSLTHRSEKPCLSQEHPCPLEIVKKTKKATMVEHIHFDKDGNARNVEVHGYPIFDKKGNVDQMIEYCLDITERKKAEGALRESEEKFRNLVETSIDLVFRLTKTGHIDYISPRIEDLYGYQPDELIGKHLRTTTPVKEVPRTMKAISMILAGKPIKNFEIKQKAKTGRIIPMEINAVPVYESGEIVGLQGIMRDITERKQAEEQTKKDLEEKNVLLHEVYHRVKNNMQLISSLLNLQSTYIKDKRALELFQNSRDRVRTMALIHDALYRSKDMTNIDFADYARKLTAQIFISYGADSNLVKLITDIKDVLLDINIGIPCGMIINELVSNSIKYAFPEGRKGEISVSLTFKNQIYKLCVKDNGIGFPGEVDLENSSTFGLKIVKSLTQQLKGSLKLEKVKGTSFTITFKKLEIKTYRKV